MILPKQVNLAVLAFLQHQADEEKERQARVIKARELYAGYMDEDLAITAGDIFIGSDETDVEGVNLMSIAIDTTIRRITLQGFNVNSPDETDQGPAVEDDLLKNIKQWSKKFFEVNKLEGLSKDLHRWTERDGEAFVILDFDEFYEYPPDPTQTGIVRLYAHERYTDAGVDWKGIQGTNYGCKAHYRNDDVNQPLDMVSKRWVEEYWEDEEIKQRQRMTLYINEQGVPEGEGDYLPARIEKYEFGDSGEWEQYQDEDDIEWPVWWTENQTEAGTSLPLPVIHFRNEQYEPGGKRLWGLQTTMDQLWVAFSNALLMTGHQILVAFGFYPTTDGKAPAEDGSNVLQVAPRQIIGNPSKSPREAALEAIKPAPIDPLLQGLDKTAIYASFVGALPVSNFIFSKAVASSETLKQGDAELVARINELMGLWGESWADTLDVARKLENNYNSSTMDERAIITAQFAPPERRDMNHLQKEAQAKRDAGVPEVHILQEVWNYSEEEASRFLQENLAEHQQGIGPEVVQLTTGGMNEQAQEAQLSQKEHGNAASEAPSNSGVTTET
jgi:hypothetical protein